MLVAKRQTRLTRVGGRSRFWLKRCFPAFAGHVTCRLKPFFFEAMAPKVTAWELQARQRRMQDKADRAAWRIDYKTTVDIIFNDRLVLADVKQFLISKGHWPGAAGASSGNGAARATTPALCDKPVEETTPQEKPKVKDFQVIEIHRNFRTWASAPPCHVRMLVGHLEPISCSFGNIKVSFVGNQREMARALGLELMEFMTGLNPLSDIGEPRQLCHILEDWRNLNEARGRPAEKLRFPVHWPRDGAYSIMVGPTGTVYIHHRIRGKTFPITLSSLTRLDTQGFWIEFNYSDRNAVVRHSEHPEVRETCICLCVERVKRAMRTKTAGSESGVVPPKLLAIDNGHVDDALDGGAHGSELGGECSAGTGSSNTEPEDAVEPAPKSTRGSTEMDFTPPEPQDD